MASPICFRCLQAVNLCCCEFSYEPPPPFCIICKQPSVDCTGHAKPDAAFLDPLNAEAMKLLQKVLTNGKLLEPEIFSVTILSDLNMDDM